jgi:hypothetical protein
MVLGLTQPITEISTRKLFLGVKRGLTVICEPVIYKMWEPRRLKVPWASTPCYMDNSTLFYSPERTLNSGTKEECFGIMT